MARADVDDEQFPAGLRVLVVDDDVTCLTVLKRMLLKCRYVVTVCSQAATALSLLRESKDGFHVVLSDVHMPDMDGFRLLELVGLEMDLPVIMMSADTRTNVVMKGIKHGACDYLTKPVRMEELKNIWQHVIRKKHTDSNRDLELSGSFDDSDRPTPTNNKTINNNNNEISNNKRGAEQEGESVNETGSGGELRMREKKKRCVVKEEEEGETDSGDPNCSSKKPRVVWSVELHQQFVNAVNQLGIDKAVPKRILELMNVPGLTRENVASHLQKFRLYLKRLSGVAHHHPGLQNPFCGPISSNIKPNQLGRLDFETLVASGQIPPQTLAALEEELLSQSSPKPHNSIREIAFGQPLMKCGPHNASSLSRQFPQSGNMNPGSVNPGFEIPGSGFPTWPGNNDLTQIMQQQQHQQHSSSISVQPSCLVIPSSSHQSQLNNFQLGDNNNNNNPLLLGQSQSQSQQSCLVQQSPMILPSQSLTSLQGLGPASQNLQISQVGGSVITAQPSISGNSSYANSGSGSNSVADYNSNIMRSKNLRFGVGQIVDEGLKNVTPGLNNVNNIINSNNHNNIGNNNNGYNFGMPGIMSGMSRSGSGAFSSDNNNFNNINMNNVNSNNMRRNNLLGFVGKGTCIPSRFAVDEIESPTNIPNFGQISGGDLVNSDPFGMDGQI
ncbi:hypothetical protein LUZ60_006256 [Juncus effusus]|nr:hypothetical protein LUZ60_006256 [Juncus effusus]